MKSAVFYFASKISKNREGMDYAAVYDTPLKLTRARIGYIRTEIIEGDDQAALGHAMKNVRPGETVLNSVLLEE